MSKFFSFKLYLEGIKKSRLQGITISAIVTALTALIPLVRLLSPTVYYEQGYEPSIEIISPSHFALPMLLLLFLTPILTLSMFSFLNKRNESDFYHSIPFTRPCVYFSFLASVLTWLTVTLAASLALTTVLWCFVPYTAFSVTTPLLLFGTYFLATLLLTGFTALAMTLTGTLISNLLIFALLFGFVRISGALFVVCLENQFPLMITELTPGRLLLPEFNMPLALLLVLFTGDESSAFSNAPLWIYTAVISILLIAAGCFFYTKRRSEMAGKSAPNRILQHIYRCAVALPMTFLIVFYALETDFDSQGIIILTVLTLIVYYLYEILTTKRLKNCLKASLFLPVLLVGGLLFGGGVTIASNVAASYAPDADELKSVSIYRGSSYYYSDRSYQNLKTQAVEITDPKVLEFVADKLAEMKAIVSDKGVDAYQYPNRRHEIAYYEGDVYDEDAFAYADPITLKITEKSGRVCGRTFRLTTADYSRLITLFIETKEYEDAFLSLPAKDEILEYGLPDVYDSDTQEKIWDCFANEYNALTREKKVEYMSSRSYGLTLDVWGTVGVSSFYNGYPLDPNLLPQTCAMAVNAANAEYETGFRDMLATFNTSDVTGVRINLYTVYYYTYVSGFGADYLAALKFAEGCQAPADGNSVLFRLTFEYDVYYFSRYYLLSEADFSSFCIQLGMGQPDGYEKPLEIVE
ncbi:MAG: hypothetical protein IJX76_03220 [Clostridia bacterium]|nr:hypothetical protein [Clostridia bacterium]